MTRKELQKIKEEYRRIIKTTMESPQDTPSWIAGFCWGIAGETRYNHHERGQRL